MFLAKLIPLEFSRIQLHIQVGRWPEVWKKESGDGRVERNDGRTSGSGLTINAGNMERRLRVQKMRLLIEGKGYRCI